MICYQEIKAGPSPSPSSRNSAPHSGCSSPRRPRPSPSPASRASTTPAGPDAHAGPAGPLDTATRSRCRHQESPNRRSLTAPGVARRRALISRRPPRRARMPRTGRQTAAVPLYGANDTRPATTHPLAARRRYAGGILALGRPRPWAAIDRRSCDSPANWSVLVLAEDLRSGGRDTQGRCP